MTTDGTDFFARFRASLEAEDPLALLAAGQIGEGVPVPGPFGAHPLVYADHVASGRALRQVEEAILGEVLPYYANSHSEASFCGRHVSRLREAARAEIARLCNAPGEFATIFTGAGATAGLNRLTRLLGVEAAARAGARPAVVIGPYEHHSNILPWRESGAEVIEVPEAAAGGPDLAALETILDSLRGRPVVGAFSAASNVTGILTDPDPVTRILKRHGALAVWDYAGAGPYLEIDMRPGTDAEKDAVVLSPHKFLGGPGASGLLIVRRGAVRISRPSQPGGGTVTFVSPWGEDYAGDVTRREEAGTPNVIGDIRAALALLVKDAAGTGRIAARHRVLRQRALARWSRNPNITILGGRAAADSLPVFALMIRDAETGRPVHHQLFTRLLSDCHGIQARGGCACAGPYAHRLLSIDARQSAAIRAAIRAGEEARKPGWTRLSLSWLLDEAKADFVIDAVDRLAREAPHLAAAYRMDPATARFVPAPVTDPASRAPAA